MIIIGITGTIGAGKGTTVDFITEKYHFAHYSARDFIVREIRKRNLPVNRDTMTEVANDLRTVYHPGYIIQELYREAAQAGINAIIESIRTVGEIETLIAETLQNSGTFYLFAVDAHVRLRYERIHERGSATDAVSFEKFLSDEGREMESRDPHKQNLAACIARATCVFQNNGDVEMLEEQVDEAMKKILASKPV